MLDDRVGPIRNVQCSVRSQLHIDGPETDIRAPDQSRNLMRRVASPLFVDSKADDPMCAKIAGDDVALPIFWEIFAAHNFKAAEFWVTSRTDAGHFSPHNGVGDIRGSGQSVV